MNELKDAELCVEASDTCRELSPNDQATSVKLPRLSPRVKTLESLSAPGESARPVYDNIDAWSFPVKIPRIPPFSEADMAEENAQSPYDAWSFPVKIPRIPPFSEADMARR